jgi:hypothetical protein
MTIPATASQVSHAGNGVTVAFPITFVFDTAADVKVVTTDADGTPTEITTGFSITGGSGSTGTCTFDVAPANNTIVTLYDDPVLSQTAEYPDNDAFPASAHEQALDKVVRQIKRLHQRVDRSLRMRDGDTSDGDDSLIPLEATRAGKFLGFDANGNPVASEGTGGGDSALRADLASSVAGNDGARLTGFRRTETGAAARTVYQKLAERLSIADFGGNGDGVANNDTAFSNANSAAAAGSQEIHLPAGDYLVTALPTLTAGVRLTGPGRIVTASTHRRTWEYGGEASTVSDQTYYVNASTGNDANSGLSSGAAFKTLQRAWNQIPPLVMHRITINYANGNYEETEHAAAALPRPAILWLTGKVVRARTDQGGGGSSTNGYVLFVPASASAVIRTIGDYKYGVYASQVNNVGFSGLNVTSNVADTVALLVAHRTGTYLQASNVILDGNAGQSNIGAYAEAGGVLEITGTGSLTDSANDVITFDESIVSIAGVTEVATFSCNGGTLYFASNTTITGAGVVQGGHLKLEAISGFFVNAEGSITAVNALVTATYAKISGAITAKNSDVYLNACQYSNQISMHGGTLRFDGGTDSWISPASASTVADPVVLQGDCSFTKDVDSEINGSGGRTNATRNPVAVSVSNNGDVIPTYLGAGGYALMKLAGGGGSKTNCTLANVDSSYGDTPVEGQVLRLISYSANSVQIVNGSTANIVGNSIVLGSNSTNYRGIELVWENGLWREVSRSLVVP